MLGTEFGQACLDLGRLQHAVNQLIERADDGLGSTGWSSDASPEGALQFRESTLGRGRYTRQQIVATVIGYGKRSQFPRLNVGKEQRDRVKYICTCPARISVTAGVAPL